MKPALLPAFAAILATAWFATPATAQDDDPSGGEEVAAEEAPDAAAGAEAAGSEAAPAKKSMALTLLQKAAFVRTPGISLQEWAGLEPVPPPNANPAQQAAAQAAQAAASSEDPPKPDPLQEEVDALRRDVALGNWDAIGGFVDRHLKEVPGEAEAGFRHILTSLAQRATRQPRNAPAQPAPPNPFNAIRNVQRPANAQRLMQERNTLLPDEVLALAAQSPVPPDDATIAALGTILSAALEDGSVIDGFLKKLEAGTAGFGGAEPAGRLLAARLLVAADRPVEAGPFLPDADAARAAGDADALNLLALAATGRHARNGKQEELEAAWRLTCDALDLTKPGDSARAEALNRAVDLASRVRREVSGEWIVESFTSKREVGREILATMGRNAIQSRRSVDPAPREAALDLQARAVKALLDAAPADLSEWSFALTLLARNWLAEAEWTQLTDTSVTRGPQMQYDPYGNVFFAMDPYEQQQNQGNQGGRPRPVPAGRMLDFAPESRWIGAVDDSFRPSVLRQLAELHLKVGAEEGAWPFIESLAATHPAQAQELADRFIEVWGENHDPNANNRRTNRYMYIYGYNPQSAGIPLTRSKQARNLEDLARWVERLRSLPAVTVDESKIMSAFLRTHSAAEVYRMEDIEKVFGEPGDMKAETIAGMLQTMRNNLAGVWRDPRVQQDNKTNRKDKEIAEEILRGYSRAAELLAAAQERYPDDWKLQMVKAALMTDENNFRNEQEQNSGYAATRMQAFGEFARAADLYADALPDLELNEQTSEVYQMWFYAALGASDLEGIKPDHVPAAAQPHLIRAAILSLPGDAADRHLTLFSNALTTRMSAAAPAVKHRYLLYGLQIAGTNERARSARELFDYYGDLVTEIQLVAHVDGPAAVGTEPFGLVVNIRHTKEIERESGGFQKYLQNQNNQPGFYNFGRPLENYRDKFEEAARAALEESFQVISVTFHPDKVQSRGADEDGWRITPYCYILMQAKGPETDTVPPLRLDLDFMDTSGYAVLPVESARLPISAGSHQDRPYRQVEVTQILDERRAQEGVLALEIKATARGLAPALERILTLNPPGFLIDRIDGSPAHVVQLEPGDDLDNDETAVSERMWNVLFRADPAASADAAKSFAFGVPAADDIKSTTYRYADADLQEVGATVALEERYSTKSRPWWLLIPAVLVVGAAVPLVRRFLRRRPVAVADDEFALPDDASPLSVIGVLQRIRSSGRITGPAESDLAADLAALESHYYSPGTAAGSPDPRAIAAEWIRRATTGAAPA